MTKKKVYGVIIYNNDYMANITSHSFWVGQSHRIIDIAMAPSSIHCKYVYLHILSQHNGKQIVTGFRFRFLLRNHIDPTLHSYNKKLRERENGKNREYGGWVV